MLGLTLAFWVLVKTPANAIASDPSRPAAVDEPAAQPVTRTVGSLVVHTGGSGAFGYTYLDDQAPGGPVFSYQSITSTGTLVQRSGFNWGGPIPIGFPFPFYGVRYTQVWAHPQGILSFDPPPIYSPLSSLSHIRPFDPDGGDSARIYYQVLANPTRVVVEYENLYRYCVQSPNRFQFVLYAGGDIDLYYARFEGPASAAAIQDGLGSGSLVYPADGPGTGRAVRFQAPSMAGRPNLAVTDFGVEPRFPRPGEAVTLTAVISNTSDTPVTVPFTTMLTY